MKTDSAPAPLLELRNVGWQVGSREILHDITFSVAPKEFVTIMGPSGSGKSSLVKLLARLTDCTTGEIHFEGTEIRSMDVIQFRRQVGLLLQDSFMFEGTVRDNLAYGPFLQGKQAEERRIIDLLQHVHLPASILEQPAATLSGGERQRVALVRMLMNDPKILLLDEITSALDPTATHQVENLIRSLQSAMGITMMMISHDVDQAKRMGGTCIFLVEGKIVEMGPSTILFSAPKNTLTRQFIEGDLT